MSLNKHDMHVLKRLDADVLRQHAPKGRKVLYVWDKAGIDFHAWHRSTTIILPPPVGSGFTHDRKAVYSSIFKVVGDELGRTKY